MTTRRELLRIGLLGISSILFFPINAISAESGNNTAQKKLKDEKSVSKKINKSQPSRIIVIDPGHGGHDPGAIGISGIKEKDITIDLARRVANTISARPGVSVFLTRDSDVFVPLDERVNIASKFKADLFVSLHADSAPNPAARGISAYTLSEKASDAFARDLAERENKAGLLPNMAMPTQDPEVAAILLDLATRRGRNISLRAKSGFVRGVASRWPLLENPMRSANFAVLRSGVIPSILIESGFLSNPHDEEILSNPRQRSVLARIIGNELGNLLKSSLFS